MDPRWSAAGGSATVLLLVLSGPGHPSSGRSGGSAAAARVFQARRGAGQSARFLAVIFPHDQLRILPYNRVLKDLNGRSPAALVEQLDAVFVINEAPLPRPTRRHELGFYLGGRWRTLC